MSCHSHMLLSAGQLRSAACPYDKRGLLLAMSGTMSKKRTQSQPPTPEKRSEKLAPLGKTSALQGDDFVSLEQAFACEDQPLPEAPASDVAGETNPADQRAERIRLLKQQVQNGSYQPDLRRVARIILYDDTDTLLGS